MTPVPFYQVCHKISLFFLKIFAPPYAQFHIKRDNGMVCKPGPNLQWPKYFFNSLSNEVPDSNLVPTYYRGCRFLALWSAAVYRRLSVLLLFSCFVFILMLYRLSLLCYIEHILFKRKFPVLSIIMHT